MSAHTWKPYAVWILLTEAVGALSGWLTREATQIYQETIVQPPPLPAQPGLSHCLGHFVRPHGGERRPDLAASGL